MQSWGEMEANRWYGHKPYGPIVPHSPVDTYRCFNEDCSGDYIQTWEFRPDDRDLDESAILCPACGHEGELIFRRWLSEDSNTGKSHQ